MRIRAAIAVAIVVATVFAVLRLHERPSTIRTPPVWSGLSQTVPAVCVSYPHALVRCGVASVAEFETQRSNAYLREHYSEIGVVHPAIVAADEWDFASFRGPNGIVWTPRKVLIRAGEHVLRDTSGNTIRARCGNRLSREPRSPVAFVMPPEMKFEVPQVEFTEPPLSMPWADKLDDILVPPLPQAPSMSPVAKPPERQSSALAAAAATETDQPAVVGRSAVEVAEVPEPRALWLLPGLLMAWIFLRARRIRP